MNRRLLPALAFVASTATFAQTFSPLALSLHLLNEANTTRFKVRTASKGVEASATAKLVLLALVAIAIIAAVVITGVRSTSSKVADEFGKGF